MAVYAAYAILAAAVFDVFDGAVARLLHVHSDIGRELDSLADLVSFGLAPAFILYRYLELLCTALPQPLNTVLPGLALLLPAFTAVRLANFNVSAPSSEYFTGLPCPASGLLIASVPLILNFQPAAGQLITGSIPVLLILITGLCALMISKLHLITLKFKGFGWKFNEARFILISCSLLSIILLRFAAIPVILVIYLIISLINNYQQTTSSKNLYK